MKQRKKIPKDSKKYLKRMRVYPAFLYKHLDKWLKTMSSQGWHVVHCGWFTFLFEKGAPEEKEYFTYGLSTQEGKYSISMRYPLLEKTFGLRKSKINSNKAKKYEILEVDMKKIRGEKKIAYLEMIGDRNRLYLKYFLRNASIIIMFSFALILICLL